MLGKERRKLFVAQKAVAVSVDLGDHLGGLLRRHASPSQHLGEFEGRHGPITVEIGLAELQEWSTL
jgi:hypothetical protein